MGNVLDVLPDAVRNTVVAVLEEVDQPLLFALRAQEEPTVEQCERVEDLLCTAFRENLRVDDEPTEFGREIDDALGAFVLHWCIERRPADSET